MSSWIFPQTMLSDTSWMPYLPLPHVYFQHLLSHKALVIITKCPDFLWVRQGYVCLPVCVLLPLIPSSHHHCTNGTCNRSLLPKTSFPVQNKRLKLAWVIVPLAQVRAASQVWLTIDVYLIRWKICSGTCSCPFRAGAVSPFWAGQFHGCQQGRGKPGKCRE